MQKSRKNAHLNFTIGTNEFCDYKYWQALEQDISNYAKEQGFPYRINDLPYGRSEKGKPVIVNYFYHEKIRLTK